MGIISKGILGGFSGTVGNVVGGSWKGIDYMRSQPAARKSSFTQAQLEQQARFALVVKFLQPLTGLLAVSFRDYAVKMSGFNNAMKYALMNAITGAFPAYTIDYSLVLVSRGDLPNALAPTAAATVAGQVNFTWTDNTGTGKAAATDAAILVVYCPARRQCIYLTAGALRPSGKAVLAVPSFSGQLVETYIGFISADGRYIATSIFTGELTVL
jgi:uncharacterized protein DUF6266